MSRVVHFEIPANDPKRASTFYTAAFGWKFQKWDGPQEYWFIETGPKDVPGINGGLFKRGQGEVGYINTVDVTSLEEAMAMVTRAGGKIVMPRTVVPGVGAFASCLDTEGNAFNIMQFDQKAR